MAEPILHLLGLAKKAGRLEVGEEPVGSASRSRKARLLLTASDAADNTCRRVAHFSEAGNIPSLSLPYTKSELGFHLGRGSVALVALTDPGFAAAITDKLKELNPEQYTDTAEVLRTKADKMFARQREKRQHEKNLLQGKNKPWAAPSKKTPKVDNKTREAGPRNNAPSADKPSRSYGNTPRSATDNNQRTGFSGKPTGHQSSAKKPFPPASARPQRLIVRSKPVSTMPRKNEVTAHDE